MGIDCSTFWGMTPKSVQMFQIGFNRVRQVQAEQDAAMVDYQSWLGGMYVAHAISACFAKRAQYPKRPMATKEEEPGTAAQEAASFMDFARKFNSRFSGR